MLLDDVERLESERATELQGVASELELLKGLVRSSVEGARPLRLLLLQAVTALAYLRDPFDAILDQHHGVGLEDDIARIQTAARQIMTT